MWQNKDIMGQMFKALLLNDLRKLVNANSFIYCNCIQVGLQHCIAQLQKLEFYCFGTEFDTVYVEACLRIS